MKGLKKKRKEYGKTLREVAEYLGVTLRTVFNYESGRTEPNNATLKKLAEYFNCTIDELL